MEEQKQQIGRIYSTHHKDKNRYRYLFCHGARIPYLRKWVGTGKRVLDLGCRDGMLTQAFALGNHVTGVDVDAVALEMVRQKLGIETLWLDLNSEWPFKEGEFDVVVACEILEHLFFPDVVLDRIEKVLKPGGVFIGSVPNAFRMRNRWKFLRGEEFDKDPTHVRWYSYAKIQRMLKGRFGSVEVLPIQGKIAPFLRVRPIFPLFVNRLFAKDFLWKAVKRASAI